MELTKQDLFTVIPSEQYDPYYSLAGLRCRGPTVSGSWVPPAEKLLEVKIEGPSGAVSEVGWPACCTLSLHFIRLSFLGVFSLLMSSIAHGV